MSKNGLLKQIMTSFGNALIALATNGISILYGISYGIAVVIVSIGAYKMLADGASGMEALVASLKRVIIAAIIIGFSVTFVNVTVKSFSGISPENSTKKSGLNSSLFEVDKDGFNPLSEDSDDSGGKENAGTGVVPSALSNENTATLTAKIMMKELELKKMKALGASDSEIKQTESEIAALKKQLAGLKNKT